MPRFLHISAASAIEVAYVTSAGNSGTAAGYTFSSVSLGAATATREIFVLVGWNQGANQALTSATIGGVSATIVGQANNSTVVGCALIRAAVPTGATGDVAVNFAGNVNSCGVGVYRAANRPVIGAAHTSLVSGTVILGTSINLSSVSVPASGFTLSVCKPTFGGVSSPSVSGLNMAIDGNTTADSLVCFAGNGVQVSGATDTIGWTWSGSSSGVALAASFS